MPLSLGIAAVVQDCFAANELPPPSGDGTIAAKSV